VIGVLAAVPMAAVTAPAFAATPTAQVQVDRGWHDGQDHHDDNYRGNQDQSWPDDQNQGQDDQNPNWQDIVPWPPQTGNQTPAPTTNPFAGLLGSNPFAGLFGSS
jgi:hypothetical protein